MPSRRGVSYVVGVLVVLGVTLAAAVLFTQVLGFQSGVLGGFHTLDVRRLGESLVPVEGISKGGKIVLYNNGLMPTCFVEVEVMRGGSVYKYSTPSCSPVPPRQLSEVAIGGNIPSGEYVAVARTLNNRVVTFRVVFR